MSSPNNHTSCSTSLQLYRMLSVHSLIKPPKVVIAQYLKVCFEFFIICAYKGIYYIDYNYLIC